MIKKISFENLIIGISSARKIQVQTASVSLTETSSTQDSTTYIYEVLAKPINKHGLESGR